MMTDKFTPVQQRFISAMIDESLEGLPAKELAKEAGISESTVHRLYAKKDIMKTVHEKRLEVIARKITRFAQKAAANPQNLETSKLMYNIFDMIK